MNKSKKLCELFDNIEFKGLVGNGEVLSMIYHSITKVLLLNIAMEDIPESEEILKAADQIKGKLRINSVEIYPKYPSALFSADKITHVIELMHAKPYFAGKINGYLKDIEISDGDGIYELKRRDRYSYRRAY